MRPRLVDTPLGLGLVDDDAPDLSALVLNLSSARALKKTDDLVRACGVEHKGRRLVDATAGLGRDAASLAALGFDVVAIERAPLMHALWRDALARHTPRHLTFVEDDAVAYLRAVTGTADAPAVVFIDPMYPKAKRTALPQRELRLIAAAVGDVVDDPVALLAAARAAATDRVVMKRPRWQRPLATPTHTWAGASTCFDMYLTPRPAQTG